MLHPHATWKPIASKKNGGKPRKLGENWSNEKNHRSQFHWFFWFSYSFQLISVSSLLFSFRFPIQSFAELTRSMIVELSNGSSRMIAIDRFKSYCSNSLENWFVIFCIEYFASNLLNLRIGNQIKFMIYNVIKCFTRLRIFISLFVRKISIVFDYLSTTGSIGSCRRPNQ